MTEQKAGLCFLNKLTIALVAYAWLLVVFVLLERTHWFASLFAHFQPWYFLASLIVLVMSCFVAKYRAIWVLLAGLATVFFGFNVSGIFKLNSNNVLTKGNPKKARVFYANILTSNAKYDSLISHLQKDQPDLVLLLETGPEWVKQLEKLTAIYPHSKMIGGPGNFGIAALSQTPLENLRVVYEPSGDLPAYLFETTIEGFDTFTVALVHASPPVGAGGQKLQIDFVNSFAEEIVTLTGPVLVCGDFNATPWSFVLNDFKANSGLSQSQIHSPPFTWPTWTPFPLIPIDHCLFKNLDPTIYKRGSDIGSDHYPLIVEFWKAPGLSTY
ncbi:MAG: endonuclease/exonuclease/phosphatase family protein [Bdellovibrionales bacterium]|nr:endonuclease/exonuclease/phosphatase family protein [Bdellovibrionales bacterium]